MYIKAFYELRTVFCIYIYINITDLHTPIMPKVLSLNTYVHEIREAILKTYVVNCE